MVESGFAIGRGLQENHNFELYRKWLSDCDANHSGCDGPPARTELPARFLAVRDADGSDVLHLVQSSEMDGRYAALSYCWGAPVTGLVASKACVEQLFISIKTEELSKTASDAVKITRNLGLDFLWVDSLCIVQDDIDDWTRESSKMDKIYRAAYVTVVASSARSSAEGCLQPRPGCAEEVEVDFSVTSHKKQIKMVFKPHSNSISEELLNNPWNQRGWCLQEYILSRRVLHFFNNRVVWQCKEHLLAEDYCHLSPSADGVARFSDIQPYFGLHRPPSLDLWFDIVEAYSLRKLTVASDKLVAVAGLANSFRGHLHASSYMHGIWLNDIHKGLLWLYTGETRSTPAPRAPTWSWACFDGPVSHLHKLQDSARLHTPAMRIINTKEIRTWDSTSKFDTSGTQHHLKIFAPMRQVLRSDWTLHVDQLNVACSKSLEDLLYDKKEMQCHFLFGPAGEVCGWASFDEEIFELEELFCMQISTVHDGVTFEAYNVLLVVQNESRHRRVGAGEIIRDKFFDNCVSVTSVLE